MAQALGPINYATGVDSPLTALNQGVASGANIINTQVQQQQQQIALDIQRNYLQDARAVAQNPTPQAVSGLVLKYPSMAAPLKDAHELLTKDQQQAKLNSALPIFNAAHADPPYAAKMLTQQADAQQASGDNDGAKNSRHLADMLNSGDPAQIRQAQFAMGVTLASSAGPDKLGETSKAVGETVNANQTQPANVAKLQNEAAKLGGEAAKTQAEGAAAPQTVALSNAKLGGEAKVAQAQGAAAPQTTQLANAETQSKIDATAAKTKLDADTLKTNTQTKLAEMELQYGQIPDSSMKIRDESTVKSVASDALAGKFSDIANQFDLTNSWGPGGNKAYKAVQNIVGGQDQWTDLLNQYNRLRGQAIAKNLPPQVQRLTDADLKVFGAGIPKDTDSPQRIAAFMRSVATVSKLEAVQEDAQAQWAAANKKGGLGPSTGDLIINGVQVPQGMPFPAFLRQYTTAKMADYVQQQAAATVASRGYMTYATGAP